MNTEHTITIRAYEAGDWGRVQGIHDAARQEELRLAGLADAFIPLAQAAENEGLFDYQLAVAVCEGVVAGFVAFTAEELAWLYVDPALARRGIGRALVRHALARTARPLGVEVLVGNQPALALYQAEGFVLQKTLHGHMPGNERFEVSAHYLELPA